MDNPTLLNTQQNSTSSTSIVSASISPTGGAFLFVCYTGVKTSGPASNTFGVSDTFAGTGAWTVIEHQYNISNRWMATVFAYAVAGSTPGSGTITVSWSESNIRNMADFSEIASGFNATPVAQSKKGESLTTGLSVTFDTAPASDSMVVGVIGENDASDTTPPTGFTELVETVQSSQSQEVAYKDGSGPQTVTWDTGTSASLNGAVIVEVAAAAGGLEGSVTDGAEAGDTVTANATFRASISEAIEVGDTEALHAIFATILAEGAKAGETMDLDAIFRAQLSESAEAGDSFAAIIVGALEEAISEGALAADTFAVRADYIDKLLEGAVLADAIEAALVARPSVNEGAEAGDLFAGSLVSGVTTRADERTCTVAARPGAVTPGARANTCVAGSDSRTVTA